MLSLGEIASAAETWWRAGTGHLHKAGAHVRPILVSPGILYSERKSSV